MSTIPWWIEIKFASWLSSHTKIKKRKNEGKCPLFLLVIRSYLYTLPGLVSCSAGKIGGVITLHIILDTHQIFHTFRQNAAFFNHCKSEDGSVMTNDHHSLRLQISCMCICLLFLFSVWLLLPIGMPINALITFCTSVLVWRVVLNVIKWIFPSIFLDGLKTMPGHAQVCSHLCLCDGCHFLPSLMS